MWTGQCCLKLDKDTTSHSICLRSMFLFFYDPGRNFAFREEPQLLRPVIYVDPPRRVDRDFDRDFHRESRPAAFEGYRAHPDREPNRPQRIVVTDKSGQQECIPSWVTPVLQHGDEGGYYNSRDPLVHEVHLSRCNVQRTTSNYYSGGLGDRAWRRKKLKRCGVGLPDPGKASRPGPPQQFRYTSHYLRFISDSTEV
ncbi:hypothetical protein F5Y19DRAFT_430991 [Xylariaceae sp. FL1651]|nr:hypothetical protein F5Y19DRAFT_430991 [Xylariaceae sp. FL1651]